MSPRRRFASLLAAAAACLCLPDARALELDQLSARLASAQAVHGGFVQEKHLRGLPQPLRSEGRFVLARSQGMLWQLDTPIKRDYRILPSGIEQRGAGGWQAIGQQAGMAQQSRLFIALLQGDRSALERDFIPTLQGSEREWQLELVPRAGLLRQIFTAIRIRGGQYVERIELLESQGDSTVLRLTGSTAALPLTPEEKRDLGF